MEELRRAATLGTLVLAPSLTVVTDCHQYSRSRKQVVTDYAWQM